MLNFLKSNPDLQELFDSYEEVSFSIDKQIQFEGKDDLKKAANFQEGINENNYEEYFVGAVENVLSEEEKIQLEKFLVQFPAKRGELDLLRNAILQPENEFVFENKSALKKPVLVTQENFGEYAVAAFENLLSAEDLIQFNAFVASNDWAKKEFELFAKTKLQPENEIVFEGKDKLKKSALVVTAENFDEVAISSMEGLLNEAEQNQFAAAVAENEEWKKSLALYSQTVLSADNSILFEDKDSLKKKENDRGAFWKITIRFAAAASVALLIGIFSWNYFGKNPVDHAKENSFASNANSAKTNSSSVNSSDANSSSSNNSAATTVLANNNSAKNNSVKVGHHTIVHNEKNNSVAVVPVVKEENRFASIDVKNISLPASNNNGDVNFSDAYYNSMNFDNMNSVASNDISVKQAAMRWMKNKLDRSAEKNNKNEEEAAYAAYRQNKNENVTGFDLTSSAVNALGEATGANLHLAHETEGTILTIGKYNVWLNRK